MIENGTIISNRYKIIEHIDSGGMSDIYKAYCSRTKRFVALKFQKESVGSGEETKESFNNEARILSRLNSKYIVNYISGGEYMGLGYIAMDFIDGPDLKKKLSNEGKLSVQETVEIGRNMLRGLGHAHQKNLIHSDLKPQNILLENGKKPVLIDFGIAKSQVDITDESQIIGSVYYFSPEQAKAEKVDKRSDIYSFGVILYEMCTGKLPFSGEDPLTIALMHVHQKPHPPKEINADIPDSLNLIILKCLEKDPEMRYQNAIEVLSDLNKVFDDQTGSFVRRNDERKVHWLSIKRNRIILYAVLSLSIFAAIYAGVNLLLSVRIGNKKQYMPNISGKSIYEAIDQLEEFGVIIVKSEVEDSNTEGGLVVGQNPEAGSVINEGDLAVIYYSDPGYLIDMPQVSGITLSEALKLLSDSSLRNVNIIWQISDDAPQNEVVGQEPSFGEMIKSSESVTLTVNTVKDKYVEFIPDVVGLSAKQAVLECSGRGFSVIYIYETSMGSNGVVTAQEPDIFTEKYSGPIRLTILNRAYDKYVSVIPVDKELLESGNSIMITADEDFDGIVAEIIMLEEEYQNGSHFYNESNGTLEVSLYRRSSSKDININTTVYIDGIARTKGNTVFYRTND